MTLEITRFWAESRKGAEVSERLTSQKTGAGMSCDGVAMERRAQRKTRLV